MIRGNRMSCRRFVSHGVSAFVLALLAVLVSRQVVFAQESAAAGKVIPTERILFGTQAASNGALYQGAGWQASEERFARTGEQAELLLALDTQRDAVLDFQLANPHGRSYVKVNLNGHDLGFWSNEISGDQDWQYHKKMVLPRRALSREGVNRLVLILATPKTNVAPPQGLPIMNIAIKSIDLDGEFRGLESRDVVFSFRVNKGREMGQTCLYHLTGWVYVREKETQGQEVYVQFEKPDGSVSRFLTAPSRRLDVGKGFGNPLYNHAGFAAALFLPASLNIGDCTIRLLVRNGSGTFKSAVWRDWKRGVLELTRPSLFIVVNWLLVILTFIVLLGAIARDRSLLVKPSIMAIIFFHIMCQWGAALHAGRVEYLLPQPWIFVLLSHGFPIIGLAVSLLSGRGGARETWQRITSQEATDLSGKRRALSFLALFFVLFMVVYLSQVPLRNTGLYNILFSDTSSAEVALARERSVNLLPNPLLRYGHNIMMAVFAPLLAVLAMQLMLAHWRRRSRLRAAFYLGCLVAILAAASISGARSYSAYTFMLIFFAWLLQKGFPIKPVQFILAVIVILTLPTMLTILREGRALTVKGFISYLGGHTLKRVVIVPMETGLQHVHYAQTHGAFGMQAIPRLAKTKGIKPLKVPLFISKVYYGNPLETTTSNTSYVYAYYSYFGLIAFVPCLLGLWLLDLSLLVYRRLSANLLLACVACVAIAANKFSGTEYTIGLFTFGFVFLLLVGWAVDRAVGKMESFFKSKDDKGSLRQV